MGSLLKETRRLMKNRQKTLPEIASATGLPFYWLRKFGTEEIEDPGVNRVQQLYEYLSGKKLFPE